MCNKWTLLLLAGSALAGSVVATAARKSGGSAGDPSVKSVFPFTGQIGTTFVASIRGTNLAQPTAIFIEDGPFTAGIEPDVAQASSFLPIRCTIIGRREDGVATVRACTLGYSRCLLLLELNLE